MYKRSQVCWEEDGRLPSNAPSPIDRIKIEEFLERNNGKMAEYIEGVIRKVEGECHSI